MNSLGLDEDGSHQPNILSYSVGWLKLRRRKKPPEFPGCQKGRVASRRPLLWGRKGASLRLMAVRQTRR